MEDFAFDNSAPKEEIMRKGMKFKSPFVDPIDHTKERFNHHQLDLTGNNFLLLRILPRRSDTQPIEIDIQHFIHGE